MSLSRPILVVIGTGAIGRAVAHRLGPSHHIHLADFSAEALSNAQSLLEFSGHVVTTHIVDISSSPDVCSLADTISKSGTIHSIVLTAGISPANSVSKDVYKVDLFGTANVIDAFTTVMPYGSTLICTSSIAAYHAHLSTSLEAHLATAPTGELLSHPEIDLDAKDAGLAYCIAKRGNILRVQHRARLFGTNGVRINVVTPGLTMTPMLRKELRSDAGGSLTRKMIETNPLGRAGTPEDIASAVSFLAGPESSYINGAEIIVDGGISADQR